jgi:hypothetical protein
MTNWQCLEMGLSNSQDACRSVDKSDERWLRFTCTNDYIAVPSHDRDCEGIHEMGGRQFWQAELPVAQGERASNDPAEARCRTVEYPAAVAAAIGAPRAAHEVFVPQIFWRRNRRALATTDNELKLMAALAQTGLMPTPSQGYNAPAATGIASAL